MDRVEVGTEYSVEGRKYRVIEERPAYGEDRAMRKRHRVVRHWIVVECGDLHSLLLTADGTYTLATREKVHVGVTVEPAGDAA